MGLFAISASDGVPLVNESDDRGRETTHQHTPTRYLTINSANCSWRITVVDIP